MGISHNEDIREDMSHLWLDGLTHLGERCPALETPHVTAHLRPPIAYLNTIDAICVAGPLCQLSSRIKLKLEIAYVSEAIRIDHPELG